MKTNANHETVARIAPRSLLLVGLLATSLIYVRSGHAQSPAANSSRAGMKTGVKVHGYWKIDVKNPDGNLASHTEFENSLTTNDPNGLSGDDALALLLSGGPSSITTTDGTAQGASAIAAALQAVIKTPKTDVIDDVNMQIPYFVMGVNTNGFNYVAGQPDQAINYVLPGPCGNSPCAGATSQSANGNTISLATSFVASAQSTITEVGTFLSFLNIKFTGKLSSFNYTVPQTNYANYTFTSANLGAPGSCGGPSQPACQVTVSPGQTVAVSVVISFD